MIVKLDHLKLNTWQDSLILVPQARSSYVTFVTLNRFCLLSKPPPPLPPSPQPPFLTDNIKLDGIPISIKSNIIASFILHFKFWKKVPLWKDIRYSYQFFCFLLFYINFYSNYDFLSLFRISFNFYLKKYFCHKFSFFKQIYQNPPLP